MIKLLGIKITREVFERDYKIVEPGIVEGIKATGNNYPYVDPNCGWKEYKHTLLINLKAVEEKNINDVLALFENRDSVDLGEFTIELPNGRKRNLLYTHTILVNHGQEDIMLPCMDQEVTLNFFERVDSHGAIHINSKGMKLAPPKKARSFSFTKVKEVLLEEQKVEFGEEVES